MNNKRRITSSLLLFCLLMSSCSTLEIGIESPASGGDAPVTAPEVTPVATAAVEPTPIPTEEPDQGTQPPANPSPAILPIQLAFVQNNNVWLWDEVTGDAVPLTTAGGVLDVKFSDDGSIIAFYRDGELWMVRSDGSDERVLVSAADLSAMESALPEYETILYGFDWVPGTHTLAFNTHLQMQIGLYLNDDLRLVNADTLEQTLLLPPGEGGAFHYSPDGQRIAVVTPGTVSLVDADGGNRREAFTYTPVVTASEFHYYLEPVWAADSSQLMAAVPPSDPYADPVPPTSIWRIPTDGGSAWLFGSVEAGLGSSFAFSPDLSQVVYTQLPTGARPGEPEILMVADLNLELGNLTTAMYYPQAYHVYDWSPDGFYFAFLSNPQVPRAMIGQIGSDPITIHPDTGSAVIDVSWIDNIHYLYLVSGDQNWTIQTGEIDGPSTPIITIDGPPPAFDFTQ